MNSYGPPAGSGSLAAALTRRRPMLTSVGAIGQPPTLNSGGGPGLLGPPPVKPPTLGIGARTTPLGPPVRRKPQLGFGSSVAAALTGPRRLPGY